MSKRSEAKALVQSNKIIGIDNLEELLTEMKKQKQIREDELAMLLNWPLPKVSKYVLEGVKKGFLLRNKMDSGMGVWVRLKKQSYNSPQPLILPSWRHDCLSIYVLTEMLKLKNGANNHTGADLTIQTERQTLDHIKTGKICDGRLVNEKGEVIFVLETEWAEKGKEAMTKMIDYAIRYAKEGVYTIFAFPGSPSQNHFHFKPSAG